MRFEKYALLGDYIETLKAVILEDIPTELKQSLESKIVELERLSGKKDKNTPFQEITTEAVVKYQHIYPEGKLPTGVSARGNTKEITEAFDWFFRNYQYTWEEVYGAVQEYINEAFLRNYEYTANAKYLIRKQGKDRGWSSRLAELCELRRQDMCRPEVKPFDVKVV